MNVSKPLFNGTLIISYNLKEIILVLRKKFPQYCYNI